MRSALQVRRRSSDSERERDSFRWPFLSNSLLHLLSNSQTPLYLPRQLVLSEWILVCLPLSPSPSHSPRPSPSPSPRTSPSQVPGGRLSRPSPSHQVSSSLSQQISLLSTETGSLSEREKDEMEVFSDVHHPLDRRLQWPSRSPSQLPSLFRRGRVSPRMFPLLSIHSLPLSLRTMSHGLSSLLFSQSPTFSHRQSSQSFFSSSSTSSFSTIFGIVVTLVSSVIFPRSSLLSLQLFAPVARESPRSGEEELTDTDSLAFPAPRYSREMDDSLTPNLRRNWNRQLQKTERHITVTVVAILSIHILTQLPSALLYAYM